MAEDKEDEKALSVTHPVGEDKNLWKTLAKPFVEKLQGLQNRHGESISEAAFRAAESYTEKQRIDNAAQEAKIRESHAKAEHEAEQARKLRKEESLEEIKAEILKEEARGLKLDNDKKEALERERAEERFAEKERQAQLAAWDKLVALKEAGCIEVIEKDGKLILVHNGHVEQIEKGKLKVI